MNVPRPGELRHRITIGRTINEVNANGYPATEDRILATVWAGIEDDASKYIYKADAANAQRGLQFSIRWRSDVQPGMWVEWNGKRHTITEIGEYDFKRRYLKLVTRSVEGVN
ncbi:MAG: phage head closure protein [Clostridia bacterium]|nr:phage head closure protein [Clostridia bacterium]